MVHFSDSSLSPGEREREREREREKGKGKPEKISMKTNGRANGKMMEEEGGRRGKGGTIGQKEERKKEIWPMKLGSRAGPTCLRPEKRKEKSSLATLGIDSSERERERERKRERGNPAPFGAEKGKLLY